MKKTLLAGLFGAAIFSNGLAVATSSFHVVSDVIYYYETGTSPLENLEQKAQSACQGQGFAKAVRVSPVVYQPVPRAYPIGSTASADYRCQ